jgi:YbbR domain-containing protein
MRSGDFKRNWALKLASLVLAFLLWSVVRAEAPNRVTVPSVPVEVANRDAAWVLAGAPDPPRVDVVITGPVRELVRLAVEQPRLVVPIDQVGDSVIVRQIDPRWVRLRGNFDRTRIDNVRPASVRLRFEPLISRLIPVAVRTTGELSPELELAGPLLAEPAAVRVNGPAGRLERIDSLRLPPVDLGAVVGPTRVRLPLDIDALEGLVATPTQVDVFVPVAQRREAPPDEALPGTPVDTGPPAPAQEQEPAPAPEPPPPPPAAGPGAAPEVPAP